MSATFDESTLPTRRVRSVRRNYPKMVQSRFDEQHLYPEHWKQVPLKRILRVRSGDMVAATDETAEGNPIYGGNGIRGYTSLSNARGPMVLIGRVGAKCGCVHLAQEERFWASEHALRVFPTVDIDLRYLAFLLGAIDFNRFATRTAQPLINGQTVETHGVALPPLEEQRAIAAFLDRETAKIDELIEKKESLAALLREQKRAETTRCVHFGIGCSPTNTKESGIPWIGRIPSGWKVAKFKRIAFFQEGPGLRNWQFTDAGIRVICVTNITEQGIDFSGYEKFVSEDEYQSTYRHFTVQPGDLLLSSSGNSWGKVASFDSAEMAILNTSTIRINEHPSRQITNRFLKWILQAETTREQLHVMMTGACQPNFGPSHLAKVYVAVPSIAEQAAIASHLESVARKHDQLIRVFSGICG